MPAFIAKNLVLKIGAILLSLTTWTGIILATNPPQSRTIQLSMPQTATDLEAHFVRAVPLPDVSVTVAGTREHMNAFHVSDLHPSVSYQGVTHAGMQRIPVRISNSDPDVEIESAPTSVSVDIDTMSTRSKPVELLIQNPPPQGYITTATSLNPSNVTVSGPTHELDKLKALVKVDLGNDKTNLEADLPVVLSDTSGKILQNVTATPTIIRVAITVSTTSTSRSSAVVPKTTGTVATGYQLTGVVVSPSTVTLSGPRDVLNGLDSIATQSINLSGLTSGETVSVNVTPPSGVSASPGLVTVTLVISKIAAAPPSPSPSPTSG